MATNLPDRKTERALNSTDTNITVGGVTATGMTVTTLTNTYLTVDSSGNVIVSVPDSDPSVAGALYTVSGALYVSAG